MDFDKTMSFQVEREENTKRSISSFNRKRI